MKNNYNTLHQYILDNSINDYHRETVNGLFRSVLEPVISNQKFEACIVFRLFDVDGKSSSLKRLSFSGAKIYSFSDILPDFQNSEKENIWGSTEFIIVIGSRYSACLIWDYSLSDKKEYSPVCYLYNSALIGAIAKKIAENSSADLKETLLKYMPDRRENKLLNVSINSLASMYNSKNEEVIFSEIEKEQIYKNDDSLQTASIVAEKAKFVAHEIKNNLSIINLYSKIVQKRLEGVNTDEEIAESLQNALKNITNASENISAHINDLRCLSSPYITEFYLKDSINSVINQCREKADKSGVSIECENIDDFLVNTDRIKFECSLMNVIYNAIEASNKGCTIFIYTVSENDIIRVFIKNNGEKIPQEIQSKIFEVNFTTKEKGNGLGLTICKKQLELVNGDIKLIHSNDEETLFEITLGV